MNKALFSSESTEWATPPELFDKLNARFSFTLDPASTESNALCQKFYTIAQDGLSQSWKGERVFLNPPYGRQIGAWCRKACVESEGGALVVGLLPARTDTGWWHEYIQGKAQVVFLRGRIKFGQANNSAPFPSCVVVWWGQNEF